MRGRAHRGPRLPHHRGGGQPAARDVAHAEPDPAGTEVGEVEPVAADVDLGAARDVAGRVRRPPRGRAGRSAATPAAGRARPATAPARCARATRRVPARAATSSRNGRSACRYGRRPAPSASTSAPASSPATTSGTTAMVRDPARSSQLRDAAWTASRSAALGEVDEHRPALRRWRRPRGSGRRRGSSGGGGPSLVEQLGGDPDRGRPGIRAVVGARRRPRTRRRWPATSGTRASTRAWSAAVGVRQPSSSPA